jgi:hypothetical protein
MTSVETAGQRGTVLPLVAISLAVVLGFAGMAVDVTYLEYWQQRQQLATDAAAVGGAQQLGHGNCSNATLAETAADLDATLDGFPNAGHTAVTVVSPPSSGPYANNACAVSVQITTQNVSTFFSRLFGTTQGLSESTQAVAVSKATGTGCIYLLSTTVDQNFNGANVNSQCGILINDTANFNGSTIAAPYIGYAGSAAPNLNGANFTNATPVPMLLISDPCPEIPGCAYLTANPPASSSCTAYNGNGYNGALQQGCYSNLNLNGANVTLNGTYVFTGTSNFNGAHITGSGVTIYVTASGTAPNFNGASVSLSPPASGNQIGVLYYQVPANTGSANFNGSTNQYSGLIYAPDAPSVNFNGTGGGYVVLVFGGVNFNGSSAQEFATPPPGQSLVTQAVIAE